MPPTADNVSASQYPKADNLILRISSLESTVYSQSIKSDTICSIDIIHISVHGAIDY